MSAAVRLTPPQVELLRDIVDKPMYVQTFSRWGKTAVALERNGLANVRGTGDGIQAEVTITADGLREARRRGLVSTAAVTEAATMAGRLRDPAFRDRAIRAGYVAGQVTDVTTLAGRLAVEEAAASTRLDGETHAIEGPVTVGEALPRADAVPASWLTELEGLAEAYMCANVQRGENCNGHPSDEDNWSASGLFAVGRCEMALRVRDRISGLRAGINLPDEPGE